MSAERPSVLEILEEAADLSAGLGVLLLPALLLAMPCVVLVVVPLLLLLVVAAIPVGLAAAILAPPYLLVRAVRTRRARR